MASEDTTSITDAVRNVIEQTVKGNPSWIPNTRRELHIHVEIDENNEVTSVKAELKAHEELDMYKRVKLWRDPRDEPVTNDAERAASRSQINKLLRGLPQGTYLDVSDMTPNGENIRRVTYKEVQDYLLHGLFHFGPSIYPFVSDNYNSYVRALVSLCGKDFINQHRARLDEIREMNLNW